MLLARSTFLIIAWSAICLDAKAQEYPFIIEQLPQHLQARVNQQAATLQVVNVGSVDEYFVDKLKLWNTSSAIRVCFFGGSTELRSRIAGVASQWTEAGGYLPLDFGSAASPHLCGSNNGRFQIRVGFEYKGYWSTVGTDSENLLTQSEQSMNLALFNINPPPEPKFSRIVLHEFGHAIGLQHEHQSYKAPCVNDFDWNAIYNFLQGDPNYWSIEQIDQNLKPKPSTSGNDASRFDVDSIMLYSFPKEFYKAGVQAACYTAGNSRISDKDKEFMRKYYPSSVAAAVAVRNQALIEFNNRIDALSIDDIAKSVAKISAARLTSEQVDAPFNIENITGGLGGLLITDSNNAGDTLNYFDRSQVVTP